MLRMDSLAMRLLLGTKRPSLGLRIVGREDFFPRQLCKRWLCGLRSCVECRCLTLTGYGLLRLRALSIRSSSLQNLGY
jgi:hypothetical protein